MVLTIEQAILLIILAIVAGIVYCLRVVVLTERRVARIELHVEKLVQSILKEELVIEKSVKKKSRK